MHESTMLIESEGADMFRCAMTGQALHDTSGGIYDDGEWIGWDWINSQLYKSELREECPDLAELFEDLVENARHYHALTSRHLQIWANSASFMPRSSTALLSTSFTPRAQMAASAITWLKSHPKKPSTECRSSALATSASSSSSRSTPALSLNRE